MESRIRQFENCRRLPAFPMSRALSAGMGKVQTSSKASWEFQNDTLNQESIHDMRIERFRGSPDYFCYVD